jgi:hypothetical protein
VSRPCVVVRARVAARIRRILQCISPLLALRQQSWPHQGCKFLSEKTARPSEKIAGIDMLSH